MKTIIVQDGTNNVLKQGKNASQNFKEHKKLVDKCIKKFDPDVCVVCEMLLLKCAVQNKEKKTN